LNNDTILISGSETVLAGRDYNCYMYTTVVTVNATENRTSAITYSFSVTTMEEKGNNTTI